MKNINEYTEELYRRIDEKKLKRAKNRKIAVVIGVSAALLIVAASAVVPAMMKAPVAVVEISEGNSVELKTDNKDRYVENNGDYGYSTDSEPKTREDRSLYEGLMAFTDGGDICFSFRENGAIYRLGNDAVEYIRGTLSNGIYFGGSYYDGGVYMPAASEILCGLVRTNGICRYDLESGETTCVVSSKDRTSSVLISGKNMFYAAIDKRSVTIKLCDLETGKIYIIAKINRVKDDEYAPYNARICLCSDRLAVLYDGSVYTVTYSGEVTRIAENAGDVTAEGDRIFVFRSVSRNWSDGYGHTYFNAAEVTVYDAASGKMIAGYKNTGYVLAHDINGFVVYENRLVGVRDGNVYLVDPTDGREKMLLEGSFEYVLAARVGEKLLIVGDLGQENSNDTGKVFLASSEETLFMGALPDNINSLREERLTFSDIGTAVDTLFYTPAEFDIPLNFKALDIKEIYGSESVRTTYAYGEEHEPYMGTFTIGAAYNGKALEMRVYQEIDLNRDESFTMKLGWGDFMYELLFGADTLPVARPVSDGTLYYDLIENNGEPRGIISWFEDSDGNSVDISVRMILNEANGYIYILEFTSDKLTYEDVKSLIVY